MHSLVLKHGYLQRGAGNISFVISPEDVSALEIISSDEETAASTPPPLSKENIDAIVRALSVCQQPLALVLLANICSTNPIYL